MLIDGDDDLRTPPSDGGEMMFRALKYLKVPTVMVRFPGETHELSRSGKPQHRVERLQHIVGWFDKWLMGQAKLYRRRCSSSKNPSVPSCQLAVQNEAVLEWHCGPF